MGILNDYHFLMLTLFIKENASKFKSSAHFETLCNSKNWKNQYKNCVTEGTIKWWFLIITLTSYALYSFNYHVTFITPLQVQLLRWFSIFIYIYIIFKIVFVYVWKSPVKFCWFLLTIIVKIQLKICISIRLLQNLLISLNKKDIFVLKSRRRANKIHFVRKYIFTTIFTNTIHYSKKNTG